MRPMRTPRDLGLAVRRARLDAGLTQAALAECAGVGRQWLSELEGGKRSAEVGLVFAVLDALDLAATLAPVPPPRPGIDLAQVV